MDAVILTWRWQNLLTIWAMVILLYIAITFASQMFLRANAGDSK